MANSDSPTSNTAETEAVRQFQAVRDYRHPSVPAADWLQRASDSLRKFFKRSDTAPKIASDQLKKVDPDRLDDAMSPPACGPLINELEASLACWVTTEQPDHWLKLVVLPPCDENGILETWAKDGGHQLLDAPSRSELVNRSCSLVDFSGEGVLVIPHLEHWFLRHQRGLGDVRALLAQLQTLERHCVIGCNSWAWAFLCKAVNANTLLPDGITFQAFDANRLHRWFMQLNNSGKFSILSSHSGNEVLGAESGVEFFKPLAARSQGIPWVAWNLWRRSLRTERVEDTGAKGEPELAADSVTESNNVLWAGPLDEFVLPGEESETTLLVLQALLIHGSLSVTELNLVLPLLHHSSAIAALTKAGLVEKQGSQLQLIAAAYPTIRSGLKTAGFPLDIL